jgi:AbrB family looped-hinge helix DNA binding protein
MESAITVKGQATIPKVVREHLNLKPGESPSLVLFRIAKLHWAAGLSMFLLFFLNGCADTTQITVEPGAALGDYHILEVGKVSNDTGQTFSVDIIGFFTDELKTDLREKGYDVADQGDVPGKVLIVNCSIVSYSPSSVGTKAEAMALNMLPGGFLVTPKDTTTVKATLLDQKTGKVMADIVSNQSETETGLMPATSFGYGHGLALISTEKLVLREAAWGVASRIDQKMKCASGSTC